MSQTGQDRMLKWKFYITFQPHVILPSERCSSSVLHTRGPRASGAQLTADNPEMTVQNFMENIKTSDIINYNLNCFFRQKIIMSDERGQYASVPKSRKAFLFF
jgi:hypothetical protein